MSDGTPHCVICDRPVAPGTRGPGGTCGAPECRTQMAEWLLSRQRRTIQSRRERLAGRRTCESCGRTLPLDVVHFPPSDGTYLRRVCRDCWRPKAAAHNRAYRRALLDHPVQRALMLQDARLRSAFRRQTQTGSPAPRHSERVLGAYRHDTGRCGLDPLPLREWLETVIECESPDLDQPLDAKRIAAALGVDSRAIWRIRHGEHRTVSLAVADRMLTNYGRPVVIRSRDLERRLVRWAQELPGNGARLLAYMDRAEAVAHLADVPVMFLGDLWPALDEDT